MSPVYRHLAALFLLAWPGDLFADDAVSQPECTVDVCVINVIASNLISSPCEGYSVLVAYSKLSTATLIQCNKPATSEENKSFIYDRSDHGVMPFEVDGGRFIRPDYLARAQTEGIPDRFGSVPLCPAKNRKPAAPGELLIAEKQPSNSEGAPYCYRIHYIVAAKNSLAIRSDDGQKSPPLSEKATAEWALIREKLSRYIDDAVKTNTRPLVALVTSERAWLYRFPDSTTDTKTYLVKGDKVEIVDGGKSSIGWWLVRYITKTGKPIERWIQTRDLDAPRN